MLIPIFGLHFAFFVWTPYANMDIQTEIVFSYIESFFFAFQVRRLLDVKKQQLILFENEMPYEFCS
jgi:hypothetical protein